MSSAQAQRQSAAIFLEGSYRCHLAGTTDPYFAGLGEGVEALARQARERAAGAETALRRQVGWPSCPPG